MTQTVSSRLFEPYTIGKDLQLQHRVILAPLTRGRTTPSYALHPFAVDYYAQRASVPGTLLIAEGTIIHPKSLGLPGSPGIWSQEQIEVWGEARSLFPYYVLAHFSNFAIGYNGCTSERILHLPPIVRRRSSRPSRGSERARLLLRHSWTVSNYRHTNHVGPV